MPFDAAILELQQLLPRAERFHHKDGASTREAWGRASLEYPELRQGRALVECALIWKTSTGNLERRFPDYREVKTRARASIFDTTVESCLVAMMGPPAKLLQSWIAHGAASAPNAARIPIQYLSDLEKLHTQYHGRARQWKAGFRQERRDAGVSRTPLPNGPDTEAGFERKRAAATHDAVHASPE